jgi:glutamate dehydrogenase
LLPVLHNCGLRVVDATLAEVALDSDPVLWITTCRMASEAEPGGGCPPRAMETLRAVLRGVIEDGTLNRLVVGAQLAWPEVSLLRAYLAYAAQLGIGPQVRFASTVLQRHPEATRCLVALFRASLDPDGDGDREAAIAAAQDAVRNAREPISTADEDRIFSLLQDLIGATVRTNFFTAPAEGEHIVVLKLKPRELARAPSPRPYAEIFVYAPSFSGTHLRGGPVARGGIRWSDRIQDFRKEILDLQRTQMVKNGLIVPAGAKGGFVLRRHFDSSNEAQAEADRQYARFMAALLQVTDNYADGAVVPPPRVVCLDGDDPYLVVAADKGTAHLSDVANRVAADSGYWLGDAFASGGSRGFDHKQLGITARGAWICARRHFLELGTDIEQEPFSLAGIGDMSGDVFGNGLLLARTGRLRAAFNHVHIFLDPDPDPERAWAERKRMFDLPHSSWRDYDPDAISAGGGVFQRAAKAIELSPEARAALAIAETQLSGEELVSAILKMPVDLLWNGGVGTYVKSSDETHLDVGDRANDGVRVDARDLRARVVAEGGNLGFTRLARVEFALAGGRINSDAVDNSGGVDLSDHEVNLKVLLAQRVASGSLSAGERDRLLADSAEEASCSVLANSAYQSRAISLDVLRGARDPGRMLIATEFLERHAGLHPQLESLADAESLRARINAAGQGYTRPELAILLGYTKMLVKRELIAADVPDHPSLHKVLRKYFPEGLRRDDEIALHPLRREITATRLTNLVIDQAGVTLIPELTSALGAGSADVVSAYYAMDDLLGGTELRAQLAAQPITETARLAAALRIEAAIRTACRTHLSLEPCALESGEDAQRRRAAMQELREAVESALSEAASRRVRRSAGELEGDGIDRDLAAAIARLPAVVGGLGALSLMDRSAVPLAELVRLHAAVGERTRITWLLECLDELEGEGWDRIATESLYLEMLQAQRDLCARLLSAGGPHEPLDILEQRAGAALERLNTTARELAGEARLTLSPLTVLAQQIRRIP